MTIKDRNTIFLVIVGIVFINIIPFSILSPILVLLFGVTLGLLIVAIFVPDDFNFLFGFYLIGFGIRVFLSFLSYNVSFFLKGNYSPGFIFPNDAWSYSQQGWQIAKFLERGITVTRETFGSDPNMYVWGRSGNITEYDFFSSFIYSITGYSPLSLFFISGLAGSLAALFIYLIAKELFSKNVARVSCLFAFFWPSFILWSTQNLKDPVIAMFVCILLWTIFYIYRHASPGFLLLSFISVLALLKIGLIYLVIIASMIFFTGLFLFIKYLFKNKFVVILIVCFIILAVSLLFSKPILSYISKHSVYDILRHDTIFEFLDYRRSGGTYGRLALFKDANISSFDKAMAFAPLGLLYAIFAPFPWQLGSINQIIAVPETMLFYILVPFTLKGIVFAYKKRVNQSVLLLSIIISILLFLTLAEGNAGTLFRHRSIPFYLLFIFTAAGISLKKSSRNILKNEA